MRFAAKTLRESKDRREIATGAYLSGLFDEAPALPKDRSMSEEERLKEPRVKVPAILGQFRIDVSHPDFHQLFIPRGKL